MFHAPTHLYVSSTYTTDFTKGGGIFYSFFLQLLRALKRPSLNRIKSMCVNYLLWLKTNLFILVAKLILYRNNLIHFGYNNPSREWWCYVSYLMMLTVPHSLIVVYYLTKHNYDIFSAGSSGNAKVSMHCRNIDNIL